MVANPTISVPSIPIASSQNIVNVVNAIRSYLITQANQSGGRANQSGTPQQAPSQFTVSKVVYVSVTFTASGGATVAVPVLQSLVLTNTATGQTWTFNAPAAATSGGAVGSAL